MLTCICPCICIFLHVHVYVYTCMYMYMMVFTYMYLYMLAYIYILTRTCIFVCNDFKVYSYSYAYLFMCCAGRWRNHQVAVDSSRRWRQQLWGRHVVTALMTTAVIERRLSKLPLLTHNSPAAAAEREHSVMLHRQRLVVAIQVSVSECLTRNTTP